MSIYDSAYTFFKGTKVEEKGKVITIDGIRTELFRLDLQNKWRTNAVSQHFFKKIRRMSLEFNSFFAPDIYYILKTLESDRRTRTSRKVLGEVIAQMEQNTWLKNAVVKGYNPLLAYNALDNFNVTLLPHQMEFLKHYDEMTQKWRLKGYILGAAPGSGKTITGLALSEVNASDITICIVPKNAVDRVWADTLDWVFKSPREYWTSTGQKALTENYQYYVAHFEQLATMVEFFKTHHKGKRISVILDESHNLNDLKSQRTQLFIELCQVTNPISILWSSGTPIKAMGSEVIPILRTIDPFFGKEEEDRFRKIFGVSTARALDILAHRLGYMTFKVNKEQIVGNVVHHYKVDVKLKNPKPYTLAFIKEEISVFIRDRLNYYTKNMDVYVDKYLTALRFYEKTLTTAEQRAGYATYRAMADDMHRNYSPMVHVTEPALCNAYEKKHIIPVLPKDLREDFLESRSVYKYVGLKVKGEALGRILGKKRAECCLAMLEEYENYSVTDVATGEKFKTSLTEIVGTAAAKTVIFTSYVEVVDQTARIFSENKFSPLKVYGQTNHELPAIVGRFDKDAKLNPLIATLQSLSTAVPLVMANTVVFLNAPFRIHEYEQACSRVDRLGQKESVHIYDVYLDTGEEANISTRSMDIMKWSQEMVEAMLGKAGGGDASALESIREDYADSYLPEDVEQSEGLTSEVATIEQSSESTGFSW